MFFTTSQLATAQILVKPNSKDTSIILPKKVLKHVIKDIELGDYYYKQWDISKSTINLQNQQLELKDSVITQYKLKDNIYLHMLKNDSLIYNQQDILIKIDQKTIQGLKRKQTFIEIIGGAIISGLVYLQLK